jgi:L-ascorbate metabolism protein UlaG (beta-lactamase superfamily)
MLTRRRAVWPARIIDAPFAPPGRAGPDQIAATFIGQSTFLLQVGGITILTDPIWSQRASPVSFAGPRRVRDAGQRLEALPHVDLLLVSHCHYDHLDLPTLRAVRERWSPVAVTGLCNAPHLAKAGIGDAHELDWWQQIEVRGARITYVPAQHFSARTPFDRNRALWGGFVIEAGGHAVYFAGDTGYSAHFAEIRQRFPGIDLALLPIGAYEPRRLMSLHHTNPDEAVRAHLDLGAKLSVGMHFGTFQLTDEAIEAPTQALAAARTALHVPEEQFRTLRFGETIVVASRET